MFGNPVGGRVAKHDRKAKTLLQLPTFVEKGDTTEVVIETPKGSRNKYAYDPEQRVFRLKKVLPAGMEFPFDFGFAPSTLADDGDALDVLVLMDEPAFSGCVLRCRLIGVIEGEQRDKQRTIRNDRLIAVECENHSYATFMRIDDLGKAFVRELEEFFVNYHRLDGARYRIRAVHGPREAKKQLRNAMKKYRDR